MHRNPLVVFLAGLLASPATWAHSAEQTGHGLMFFHWHIADTGHVLGMSPAMLGVGALLLAIVAVVGSARFRHAHRAPAALSLAGTAAAFALIGTGLIAGAV
jgi:hypothetical protein